MKRTSLILVLVVLATIAIVTADASAYYHPTMGRFMQRDPGPGAGRPARIGSAGPAVGGGFMPRDQYADGMNLYQYVGSQPTVFNDPEGLKRLQYSYRYAVVVPEKDTGYFSSMQYGKTLQLAKTFRKLLHTKVEDLLWPYGVNAWHQHPPHYDAPESCPAPLGIMEKHVDEGIFWDTRYDLYDVENKREWRFLGTYRGSADDIIVHVPGNLGWDGKIRSGSGGAHQEDYHVIVLSQKGGYGAETVAHEVLHHLLGDTINPGSSDPDHDVYSQKGGIMRGDVWTGTRKLGCKTVKALKKKGVSESEIDASLIIK